MPIYEYQCSSCDHRLEKLQKISDPPLIDCPACNEAGLRKLVSAAAFRLKGGGWYETDFKTGSRKNVSAESSGTGGEPGNSANQSAEKSSSSESTGSTAGSEKKSDKKAVNAD